jgi:hypothetical protein
VQLTGDLREANLQAMRGLQPFSWRFVPTPARAREGRLCDAANPNPVKDGGFLGSVFSLAYDDRSIPNSGFYVGGVQSTRSKMYRATSTGWSCWKMTRSGKQHSPIRILHWQIGALYSSLLGDPWHIPWLFRPALSGGGTKEDSVRSLPSRSR